MVNRCRTCPKQSHIEFRSQSPRQHLWQIPAQWSRSLYHHHHHLLLHLRHLHHRKAQELHNLVLKPHIDHCSGGWAQLAGKNAYHFCQNVLACIFATFFISLLFGWYISPEPGPPWLSVALTIVATLILRLPSPVIHPVTVMLILFLLALQWFQDQSLSLIWTKLLFRILLWYISFFGILGLGNNNCSFK